MPFTDIILFTARKLHTSTPFCTRNNRDIDIYIYIYIYIMCTDENDYYIIINRKRRSKGVFDSRIKKFKRVSQ